MPYLLLMPASYNEDTLFGISHHPHIVAGQDEHTALAKAPPPPDDGSQVKPPMITPVPGTIPS